MRFVRGLQLSALLFIICAGAAMPARAQPAEPAADQRVPETVPPEAAGPSIDVDKATNAYLAMVSGERRARSDAYFEGGYWLQLLGWIYGLAVAWLLLQSGASAWMSNFARRATRFRPLQSIFYWLQYLVVVTLLDFPLAFYEDFLREHQYGLSNLSFGGWMGELGKGLLIQCILGGIGIAILYGILRRAQRNAWLWATVFGVVFIAFGALIAPVYIAPVFNKYMPLSAGPVRDGILRMARANGVEVGAVYQNDASKQSTRVSANVSGLFGTTRITVNDNLLNRCSLAQIEAVTAHEIGHYVLHHVIKMILEMALILAAAFAFVQAVFRTIAGRYHARWGVDGIEDVTGLPLLIALISTALFVFTPLINTMVRTQESEADLFGLNVARQPDAFSQLTLELSSYRKLAPAPWEEFIFYDHPSGRTRIHSAMRWKAEHLGQ